MIFNILMIFTTYYLKRILFKKKYDLILEISTYSSYLNIYLIYK